MYPDKFPGGLPTNGTNGTKKAIQAPPLIRVFRGIRGQARFLTRRPANAVITTFITHHFSRGPWTSAVQGPK